jgi:hypothetical protein
MTGAWLPRSEAAVALGIKERTLARWKQQGRVETRVSEHGRVLFYVPGAVPGHVPEHDTAMVPHPEALAALLAPAMARHAEQEAIIRQQAEEIGMLKARLAAQAVPWWRVLWQRLAGR